jgi:uncharacterized membrane protein (DUF4010 family)
MVTPGIDPVVEVLGHLLVGFGLGALVGLEREQSESGGTFAGSRTFPLFALYGGLVAAFVPSARAVTVAYAAKIVYEGDVGLTTLVAALLTTLLGAVAMHSDAGAVVAVVVGGAVTVLLSVKDPIHAFADRIEKTERIASAKFVLVVLVVLPSLPNRSLDVLYIAVTGVVGGFVSSTATTVSMAEKTVQNESLYRVSAFAVVTASVVMFPRALVEVAVVNPRLLVRVAPPLGAMTTVGVMAAGVLYWRTATDETVDPEPMKNPFRLRPALFFGGIFAVVLLVSEHAHGWFGSSGIYVTAFLSGLADVDAMTISLSALAADGTVSERVAATGIVVAAVANTLLKAGLAWLLGTGRLGRLVSIVLGLVVVTGVALIAVGI